MIYDPTSDYYNDICYTYTTDSKTDIILFDRQNEFNNKYYLCPKNCTYNGYNFTNKNVICLCEINEGITLISQFNEEELIFKFSNSKSLTNFNVLKCFKLLFSKNGILINIGFYIILLIILLYIISVIYFYFKEYKFICEQINNILETKIIYALEINSKDDIKCDNKNNLSEIISTSNKDSNSKKYLDKINIDMKDDSEFSVNNNILNTKDKNQTHKLKKRKINKYFDAEINTIPFKEALDNDKRTFFQYYISLIKTNHILIFLFSKNKDYNSFTIKICLFFFYLALYLTVNTFFFNDSILHIIYIEKGNFNIKSILPQIIYSIIISSIIISIIKYASLTQRNILEIKREKSIHNLNIKVTIELKYINLKFIFFFIYSFIFLLFFWYYLSCFCAVYKNTQIYLIETTLISYIISLIYPFIIYLFPGIFRISAFNNPGKCLYKISQVFQLF